MSLDQARMLAHERQSDLVEVNPNTPKPVVKIIDYGKYIYDQTKKQKKSKSHAGEVKEVRISYGISDHDFGVKVNRAKKFFELGEKVRLSLIMRGRENQFQSQAMLKMKEFATSAGASFESNPSIMGKRITAIITKEKS